MVKDITGHDDWEMFDWYNTVDETDSARAVKRFERFTEKELTAEAKKEEVDHSVDQGSKTK